MPSQESDRHRRAPFRVGDWLVEPDLDRISRGEERRMLRPRVTELLVALTDRAGELAPKRDLVDAVWRTEFVTDNALTHLVAELRTALGDDAADPAYVETIPRRGYRLVAPVVPGPSPPGAATASRPRFALVGEADNPIELAEGESVIGRALDAAIHIDSSEVSRRHARIVVEGEVATIEDLGSKNGTYLRGRRIAAPARLENADEITIGVNVARFRFVAADAPTRTEDVGAG
jgi:DNA-binding winged helix-turn-helix (wHTH) protein